MHGNDAQEFKRRAVLMENKRLDILSFDELFRLHAGEMRRFVSSYVNDDEVARDIVHDVFINIWEHRENLDSSYSLKSYLFTLSKNHALNYLKHLRMIAMNEQELAEALLEAGDELEQQERRIARLEIKLAELPEKQRIVVEMCVVEGKSYQEVADNMGISLNTVKTHLARAMKFLRDELREDIVLLFVIAARYKK